MSRVASGARLAPIDQREPEMPKVSKESAAHVLQQGPVEDHHEDLDGYTVNFTAFAADIDGTPLLKGLPDDSCQCPHWGYVVKGRLTFRFADREEILEAGDAFYLPPGHIPVVDAGTEIVQFSPAAELRVTEETMTRNMQALSSGS
jgi:AraC-like ligand binding domain